MAEFPPRSATSPSWKNCACTITKLKVTIPPQLGRLANLKTLYLYSQTKSAVVFRRNWAGLSSLQVLHISLSRLSGNIPPELGQLSNLQTLELTANQLSGNIPSSTRRVVQPGDTQTRRQQSHWRHSSWNWPAFPTCKYYHSMQKQSER